MKTSNFEQIFVQQISTSRVRRRQTWCPVHVEHHFDWTPYFSTIPYLQTLIWTFSVAKKIRPFLLKRPSLTWAGEAREFIWCHEVLKREEETVPAVVGFGVVGALFRFRLPSGLSCTHSALSIALVCVRACVCVCALTAICLLFLYLFFHFHFPLSLSFFLSLSFSLSLSFFLSLSLSLSLPLLQFPSHILTTFSLTLNF